MKADQVVPTPDPSEQFQFDIALCALLNELDMWHHVRFESYYADRLAAPEAALMKAYRRFRDVSAGENSTDDRLQKTSIIQ